MILPDTAGLVTMSIISNQYLTVNLPAVVGAAVVGGAVVAAVVGGAVVVAVVGGAIVALVGAAVVAGTVVGGAVVTGAAVVAGMGLPGVGGALVMILPSDSLTFNMGTMLRTSILSPTSTDNT